MSANAIPATLATTEQRPPAAHALEPARPQPEPQWEPVAWLPCRLAVDLRIPSLTVRDLANLAVGDVLRSDWPVGTDLPVKVNGQVIGWMEFEVAEEQLAVRFTELA